MVSGVSDKLTNTVVYKLVVEFFVEFYFVVDCCDSYSVFCSYVS